MPRLRRRRIDRITGCKGFTGYGTSRCKPILRSCRSSRSCNPVDSILPSITAYSSSAKITSHRGMSGANTAAPSSVSDSRVGRMRRSRLRSFSSSLGRTRHVPISSETYDARSSTRSCESSAMSSNGIGRRDDGADDREHAQLFQLPQVRRRVGETVVGLIAAVDDVDHRAAVQKLGSQTRRRAARASRRDGDVERVNRAPNSSAYGADAELRAANASARAATAALVREPAAHARRLRPPAAFPKAASAKRATDGDGAIPTPRSPRRRSPTATSTSRANAADESARFPWREAQARRRGDRPPAASILPQTPLMYAAGQPCSNATCRAEGTATAIDRGNRRQR